jgi:site-specific DNA-methyltransferase (adenine-specific)
VKNKIIWGDCLLELKELKDNSIDSIVTDPPYGLSFMGKKWDYEVPSVEVWKECLRVLKHGGHLLSFAGSRTYHRMAVNIEDAGFDIRDQIMWIYGSGFPKSLNIGRQLAKMSGEDVKGEFTSIRGNSSVGLKEPTPIKDREQFRHKTKTDWDGWGTALKPAHEPIVVARKPISEKNIALNVLKWGTAGINIDGCRVEYTDGTTPEQIKRKYTGNNENNDSVTNNFGIKKQKMTSNSAIQGRFPANIILDEEAGKMLDEQSGVSKSSNAKRTRNTIGSFGMPNDNTPEYSDKGGASRFFYCAKASKSERNKGCAELQDKTTDDGREVATNRKNNHPTVKPIKLMRYLVRLVTPKGGLCLDPFIGSGTTAIACKLEGFDYLGIEREADYIPIAEARIKAYQFQDKL